MSAQLKELGMPVVSPLTKVFDRYGRLAGSYTEPEFTIDPEDFYGSVTKTYTADSRAKLRAFLSSSAIAIQFGKVTEGRPYTLALRLRELGYQGDLHAVGAINREIMHLLMRVGFTHFHLTDQHQAIPKEIVSPFSFSYQIVGTRRTGHA
ncbi:MAG: DUF934 domain-containing protein [Betaproteobacteria bacterium]|nr:DUF934 domain-containing protein [Betaproteobacteria bacterium]NCA15771.1 DUF934 domain-containing protein [Betaproteobacteria bacterium]NDF03931.1 DUF934 domain-containing protein [Betaproteobacteria bacterium]